MTSILRTSDIRPSFELIPPMADEFTVYGDAGTVERARAWAIRWRYLLVDGLAECAHGLYLMGMCPTGLNCCEVFDHTNLWVPDRSPGIRDAGNGRTNPPEPPFILTHPYRREVPESAHTYARAHGLHVDSRPTMDGWYGYNSLPIRFTLPENWPMWPIEREVEPMFSARPVIWPDDEEDPR